MSDIEFEKLYNKYKRFIKGYSNKYKVNGYTPEDIEQELLMMLKKCSENYDKTKNANFFTYYRTSCYYHLVNLRKLNKKYYGFINDLKLLTDTHSVDSYKYVENENIKQALKKIKNGDIVDMYYIKNMTLEQIASKKGISHQAINRKLKIGLQELKKELKY